MRPWSSLLIVVVTGALVWRLAQEGEPLLGLAALSGLGILSAVVLFAEGRGRRRLRGEIQGLRQRLREANERIVVAENSSMARAERTLADTRAEVERLRAEIEQSRQERERLDQALRQTTDRAKAEASAAAERHQRLEAALAEARSEAQRLSSEVGRLREEAEALPSPVRTVVEPEPVIPPEPAMARPEAAMARPEAERVAPIPAVASAATPPQGLQPSGLAGARSGVPHATLLLVDDDADFRAAAADMLKGAGYQVIEAGDGPSALEQAQRHPGPIHLLVTDLMMPGMNGRQTAQRLATIRPGVGVLYISGYVDEAAAREAIAGEAADFLSKPFDMESFTAKVRDLLTHALRASA